MNAVLNWDLLKQPLNWVIVFVMCTMALFFLAIVFPEPNASDN